MMPLGLAINVIEDGLQDADGVDVPVCLVPDVLRYVPGSVFTPGLNIAPSRPASIASNAWEPTGLFCLERGETQGQVVTVLLQGQVVTARWLQDGYRTRWLQGQVIGSMFEESVSGQPPYGGQWTVIVRLDYEGDCSALCNTRGKLMCNPD